MGDIRKMNRAAERAAVGTVSLAAAGLAIATDTTQAQNANAMDYMIDGIFYQLAATDGLIDLSTAEPHPVNAHLDAAAAVNPDGDTEQKALFLLSVDAAGTVHAHQSRVVPASDMIGWPEMPLSHSVIGGLVVETDTSTTFTPGTTALNAAGITTTYVDMAHVPADRR